MNTDKTSLENESQPSCLGAVISRLSFHVHNDIEEAAKFYKIPLCFYDCKVCTTWVLTAPKTIWTGIECYQTTKEYLCYCLNFHLEENP